MNVMSISFSVNVLHLFRFQETQVPLFSYTQYGIPLFFIRFKFPFQVEKPDSSVHIVFANISVSKLKYLHQKQCEHLQRYQVKTPGYYSDTKLINKLKKNPPEINAVIPVKIGCRLLQTQTLGFSGCILLSGNF